MVRFTTEQIRAMMDVPECVRNISVIAHVDHGKTTLTDSLVTKAGLMNAEHTGKGCVMDTDPEEQERGITIKSTSISLAFERMDLDTNELEPLLVNLIDSPGHVDFNSEVTAALRVTDGALVVVDCIESVCVQTETVLQQAITERIKPVLFLNKLDRVFLELDKDPEEAYNCFRRIVEDINRIIATFSDETLGDISVDPTQGNVAFGSGLHAWAFTIESFARMYCVHGKTENGFSKETLMNRLWGDWCWHPLLQKWVQHNPRNGAYKSRNAEPIDLERGFVQFILRPIQTLLMSTVEGEQDVYLPILNCLRIPYTAEELEKRSRDIMKMAMRRWLPAGDCLLDLIANHLPSPVEAQPYKCELLYTGDLTDPICDGIRACDPNADVSIFISKMVPSKDKNRFIAFGRVWSGTVETGSQLNVFAEEYVRGSTKGKAVKRVQGTVLCMGKNFQSIGSIPCGNFVGLYGVDNFLVKSGTITSDENAAPFKTMKFSVAPVVRIAVECAPRDLPGLVNGLKNLAKSDPLVKCFTSQNGENVIAGAGELHLDICLKTLRAYADCEIRSSDPVVSCREGISSQTGENNSYPDVMVSKSANKHNRIYARAEPISEELCSAIDLKEVTPLMNKLDREHILADNFGWDRNHTKKIWTFGAEPDSLPNVLVDTTRQVDYLHEAKDHIVAAFQSVTKAGVLCQEPIRGMRVNLRDVMLHADVVHRGGGSLIPCARRAFFACQIASSPVLFEPLYLVNITVPLGQMNGVFEALASRRGEIIAVQPREGTPLVNIQAHLPIRESFGFTELLRAKTGGSAFPQMKFEGWKEVSGNPMEEGTNGYNILMETRERKDMNLCVPDFSKYYDRI